MPEYIVELLNPSDAEKYASDAAHLYRQAGWIDDSTPESELIPILQNSYCVMGALDENGHLIGMMRALSDGAVTLIFWIWWWRNLIAAEGWHMKFCAGSMII